MRRLSNQIYCETELEANLELAIDRSNVQIDAVNHKLWLKNQKI